MIKSMKLLAIIAIVAIVLGVVAATNLANDRTNVTIAANDTLGELSIRGSAEEKVEPDMVSLSIGVTTSDASAKVAVDENSMKVNEIINILNANGISNDEISTSYYSVYPLYSQSKVCIEIYPPPEDCNVIIGFRVSNTLAVTTDVDKDIGRLIDLVVEAGATNINGINFFASKELVDGIKDRLIEEAVINAKNRAELALRPLNMSIVGVKSIDVDNISIPFKVYEQSARATPILPSEQSIRVDVSIIFYIS